MRCMGGRTIARGRADEVTVELTPQRADVDRRALLLLLVELPQVEHVPLGWGLRARLAGWGTVRAPGPGSGGIGVAFLEWLEAQKSLLK